MPIYLLVNGLSLFLYSSFHFDLRSLKPGRVTVGIARGPQTTVFFANFLGVTMLPCLSFEEFHFFQTLFWNFERTHNGELSRCVSDASAYRKKLLIFKLFWQAIFAQTLSVASETLQRCQNTASLQIIVEISCFNSKTRNYEPIFQIILGAMQHFIFWIVYFGGCEATRCNKYLPMISFFSQSLNNSNCNSKH